MIVRVDVDTQNGFADPRGGLHVKGGEGVLPNVARLNADAAARGIPLLGSVDSHDFASPEFRTNGGPWPVHCVKGTWDWLKPEATLPPRFRIVGREPADVARAFDGGCAALYFEKDAYSIFDNLNADAAVALLERRAEADGERLRFEVYGIATDYCVRAAALELRKRGFEVDLVADAIAGVAPDTTAGALAEMSAAGIGSIATEAALAHGAPARA